MSFFFIQLYLVILLISLPSNNKSKVLVTLKNYNVKHQAWSHTRKHTHTHTHTHTHKYVNTNIWSPKKNNIKAVALRCASQ